MSLRAPACRCERRRESPLTHLQRQGLEPIGKPVFVARYRASRETLRVHDRGFVGWSRRCLEDLLVALPPLTNRYSEGFICDCCGAGYLEIVICAGGVDF